MIPRVADYVELTLTTPEQYAPDLKEPGHMYLSALIYLFLTVNRLFRNVRSRGTYQTVLL